MKILQILGWVILMSVLLGCGVYTFNPRGKSDIKSIAIERFENNTAEYGLEDRMTDQIIDAFISDGNLKVVPNENADALLSGTLTNYERKPYRYDENDQVESYAIRMLFDIQLKNPEDESEIWRESMSQEGVYLVDSETEEDGQQRAISRLIESVINKTTKNW